MEGDRAREARPVHRVVEWSYLECLRVRLDPVSVHVLQQRAVDVGGPLEVLSQGEIKVRRS